MSAQIHPRGQESVDRTMDPRHRDFQQTMDTAKEDKKKSIMKRLFGKLYKKKQGPKTREPVVSSPVSPAIHSHTGAPGLPYSPTAHQSSRTGVKSSGGGVHLEHHPSMSSIVSDASRAPPPVYHHHPGHLHRDGPGYRDGGDPAREGGGGPKGIREVPQLVRGRSDPGKSNNPTNSDHKRGSPGSRMQQGTQSVRYAPAAVESRFADAAPTTTSSRTQRVLFQDQEGSGDRYPSTASQHVTGETYGTHRTKGAEVPMYLTTHGHLSYREGSGTGTGMGKPHTTDSGGSFTRLGSMVTPQDSGKYPQGSRNPKGSALHHKHNQEPQGYHRAPAMYQYEGSSLRMKGVSPEYAGDSFQSQGPPIDYRLHEGAYSTQDGVQGAQYAEPSPERYPPVYYVQDQGGHYVHGEGSMSFSQEPPLQHRHAHSFHDVVLPRDQSRGLTAGQGGEGERGAKSQHAVGLRNDRGEVHRDSWALGPPGPCSSADQDPAYLEGQYLQLIREARALLFDLHTEVAKIKDNLSTSRTRKQVVEALLLTLPPDGPADCNRLRQKLTAEDRKIASDLSELYAKARAVQVAIVRMKEMEDTVLANDRLPAEDQLALCQIVMAEVVDKVGLPPQNYQVCMHPLEGEHPPHLLGVEPWVEHWGTHSMPPLGGHPTGPASRGGYPRPGSSAMAQGQLGHPTAHLSPAKTEPISPGLPPVHRSSWPTELSRGKSAPIKGGHGEGMLRPIAEHQGSSAQPGGRSPPYQNKGSPHSPGVGVMANGVLTNAEGTESAVTPRVFQSSLYGPGPKAEALKESVSKGAMPQGDLGVLRVTTGPSTSTTLHDSGVLMHTARSGTMSFDIHASGPSNTPTFSSYVEDTKGAGPLASSSHVPLSSKMIVQGKLWDEIMEEVTSKVDEAKELIILGNRGSDEEASEEHDHWEDVDEATRMDTEYLSCLNRQRSHPELTLGDLSAARKKDSINAMGLSKWSMGDGYLDISIGPKNQQDQNDKAGQAESKKLSEMDERDVFARNTGAVDRARKVPTIRRSRSFGSAAEMLAPLAIKDQGDDITPGMVSSFQDMMGQRAGGSDMGRYPAAGGVGRGLVLPDVSSLTLKDLMVMFMTVAKTNGEVPPDMPLSSLIQMGLGAWKEQQEK